MPADGKEPYLSVTAAAGVIGVTRQTVHEWINTGRLRTRTVAGRRVLYRRQVERIAAGRRPVDPTPSDAAA